jgi:hypothetical protein
MEITSGSVSFEVADLYQLADLVGEAWSGAGGADWTNAAGTLEWSCLRTADHAVDCVYAPAFFLASRRLDRYPEAGGDLTLGTQARPDNLVESLAMATRILSAVVRDTPAGVRSVLIQGPTVIVAPPRDFPPRAALELILHAHDVCAGLGVRFEPDGSLCYRLREHTRPWPLWGLFFDELADTDDPWGDLLTSSGRERRSL